MRIFRDFHGIFFSGKAYGIFKGDLPLDLSTEMNSGTNTGDFPKRSKSLNGFDFFGGYSNHTLNLGP